MIIGVSGYAGSGKDTFFKSAEKQFPERKFRRMALADQLKEEMYEFILEKFNINIFTCEREEKNIVRPLLVGYGAARRNQDEDYFVNILDKKITRCFIPVITDIRYDNEAKWIIRRAGRIVYIDAGIDPPNEHERLYTSKIKDIADVIVNWSLGETQDEIDKLVREAIYKL